MVEALGSESDFESVLEKLTTKAEAKTPRIKVIAGDIST
ncbi:hypothetical protein VCR20J5_1390082 [Vibrio crassostreae]|nr:hypothetical protein VCR20J5_1390082 [Vibrio crassostreae]CDT46619.1 hypothetical protein VCR6J2_460061 [Vibrio coralliirubri]CDT55168.1 hypothetical protein VCR4J2_590060 [Vibrio coralliirubri]CDT63805.1 hypothetical protein VCR29J2_380059 [Vibrio coralliirubri]CDT96395.1 hypothetical protein VCR8J2_500062 [Vibrio coralliirubri]